MANEEQSKIPLFELIAAASQLEPDAFAAAYGASFLLWMPAKLTGSHAEGLAQTMVATGPAPYEPSNPLNFIVYPLTRDLKGRAYVVVGRETTCNVVIDDESVSSAHCCLQRTDEGEWFAFDAGSTNGTFVNEIDAPAMGSARGIQVTPMTRIRMGSFEASFMEANQVQLLAKGLST